MFMSLSSILFTIDMASQRIRDIDRELLELRQQVLDHSFRATAIPVRETSSAAAPPWAESSATSSPTSVGAVSQTGASGSPAASLGLPPSSSASSTTSMDSVILVSESITR